MNRPLQRDRLHLEAQVGLPPGRAPLLDSTIAMLQPHHLTASLLLLSLNASALPAATPTLAPQVREQETTYQNDLTFQDAMALAGSQGKAMMMVWFHSDDARSVAYSSRVFDGKQFQEFARERTVAQRYDASKKRAMGVNYNVRYYPTVLLYAPESGQEIGRVEGLLSEESLVLECEALILGRLSTPVLPEGDEASDPMAWLAWANHCVTDGKPTDAVQAYMWCLDNGDVREGFLDRYGDYVIQKTRDLNLATRAASTMLEERRTTMAARMRMGKASDLDAHFVAAIDRSFGKQDHTQSLLVELKGAGERQEELREILFRELLERLVAERQYPLVLEMVSDPKAEIFTRLDLYESTMARALEAEGSPDPMFLSEQREIRSGISRDGILFYETLLASGKGKDANDLATRLLTLKPNTRTYVEFVKIAHRLEQPQLAEQIAQAGMEEHESEPKSIRQIQRAVSKTNTVGVKRLNATEQEKRRQEREARVKELREKAEKEGGDGGE